MSEIPVSISPRKQKQLQVIPLGDDMPYDFKRPHRHEYFEFFVFPNGGGTHFIDFTEYEIVPNSVHIVFPGQIHLLKRTKATGSIIVSTKEFMNEMNKVFYSSLFQNNFSFPCIVFDEARFSGLGEIVSQLHQELENEKLLTAEVVSSLMSLFLSHCIRSFKPSDSSPKKSHAQSETELYQKFLMLLEEHFADKNTVSFYAKKLAVTPKVLNQCTKLLAGKTGGELIQHRTLTEAKRLLLFTDRSSKEIAYELNFKDNSYFTRFFAKHCGHTPSSFRSYWEEKYHS